MGEMKDLKLERDSSAEDCVLENEKTDSDYACEKRFECLKRSTATNGNTFFRDSARENREIDLLKYENGENYNFEKGTNSIKRKGKIKNKLRYENMYYNEYYGKYGDVVNDSNFYRQYMENQKGGKKDGLFYTNKSILSMQNPQYKGGYAVMQDQGMMYTDPRHRLYMQRCYAVENGQMVPNDNQVYTKEDKMKNNHSTYPNHIYEGENYDEKENEIVENVPRLGYIQYDYNKYPSGKQNDDFISENEFIKKNNNFYKKEYQRETIRYEKCISRENINNRNGEGVISTSDINNEITFLNRKQVKGREYKGEYSDYYNKEDGKYYNSNSDTNKRDSDSETKGDRRKRKRVRLTNEKTLYLQRYFDVKPRPTTSEKKEIAKILNMNFRAVQVWFQNRRAKQKKDMNDLSNTLTYDPYYERGLYGDCSLSAMARDNSLYIKKPAIDEDTHKTDSVELNEEGLQVFVQKKMYKFHDCTENKFYIENERRNIYFQEKYSDENENIN